MKYPPKSMIATAFAVVCLVVLLNENPESAKNLSVNAKVESKSGLNSIRIQPDKRTKSKRRRLGKFESSVASESKSNPIEWLTRQDQNADRLTPAELRQIPPFLDAELATFMKLRYPESVGASVAYVNNEHNPVELRANVWEEFIEFAKKCKKQMELEKRVGTF